MNDIFYMESRGSMTQFNPITPEQITKLSEGSLTYAELSEILAQYGLSVDYVIHDTNRQILNTCYADYDRGLYRNLRVTRSFLEGNGSADLLNLSAMRKHGNENLKIRDWEAFYKFDVPVPMLIYDFQKRMPDIASEKVFDIWLGIYKRIDYSNGMWAAATLEYVFANAPKTEKPEPGENGRVTIYRGMGELSQQPETAISWSTHPGNALWFANHSARGTHMVIAEIAASDIVAFFPDFCNENEVLVRPNTVRNIRYEDMFAANQETFTKLTVPAIPEFLKFGRQAKKFGYKEESIFEVHGLRHILRVLLLSLIYFYSSGAKLTARDKGIMIYFSLLHDAGRTNEDRDDGHGAASIALIKAENFCIDGLELNKQDRRIAELIIRYHCHDDEDGIHAINTYPRFSGKDKKRAVSLYRICKDMDGLDRVRFNGLDYRMLRTKFARQLPIIAGCLLKENVLAIFDENI